MADPLGIAALEGERPLTGAYRLLRRVGPPDSPIAGWLARCAGGRTVLLAEPDALPGDDPLAGAEGAHVLTPRDLFRTRDGVGVEFDWCVDRLDRVLSRRADAEAPLTAGETVTLVVSLRRGMAELAAARTARDAAWPPGEWWLTDAGRPVFAPLSAGTPADAGTRRALEVIAGACADGRVRGLVSRWLDRPDAGALADASIESALFAVAEPSPIRSEVFAPARSRSLDAAARLREPAPEIVPRRGLLSVIERHIDTDIAAMTSEAVHGVLRRLRARRPRPWLLAAGAAASVLVLGALWPTGDEAPAQAEEPDRPAASAPAVDRTAPSPPASMAAVTDLTDVTARLLDARTACQGEHTCLAAVMEDPDRDVAAGVIDLVAASRAITLLDDFGGVAVLRVDAREQTMPAQLVVIVEADGRWRLRDVHDVAQPPG